MPSSTSTEETTSTHAVKKNSPVASPTWTKAATGQGTTNPPTVPGVTTSTPAWKTGVRISPAASWKSQNATSNANSHTTTVSSSPSGASDAASTPVQKRQHSSTSNTSFDGPQWSVGAKTGPGKSYAKSDDRQVAVEGDVANGSIPSKTKAWNSPKSVATEVDTSSTVVPSIPAWKRNQPSIVSSTTGKRQVTSITASPATSATSTTTWNNVVNRSRIYSERDAGTASVMAENKSTATSFGSDGIGGRAAEEPGTTSKSSKRPVVAAPHDGETNEGSNTVGLKATPGRRVVVIETTSTHQKPPPEFNDASSRKVVDRNGSASSNGGNRTPIRTSAKEAKVSGVPPPPPLRPDGGSSSLSSHPSRNQQVVPSQVPCEYEVRTKRSYKVVWRLVRSFNI